MAPRPEGARAVHLRVLLNRASLPLTLLAVAVALLLVEVWERRWAWPVAGDWYRLDVDDGMVQFGCQEYAPVRFPVKPRATRVLLLGGSTMFGYPERAVASAELVGVAAALRAALPGDVELVNLGVNGGSSTDTLRLARRAVEWGPAAVVVYDGHNEFMAAPLRFSARLWSSAAYRHLVSGAPRAQVSPGWVGRASYGGPEHAAAILERFEANLDATAELVGELPLVLATQASNLGGLDPSWSTAGDAATLRSAPGLPLAELERHRAETPDAADLAWALARRTGDAAAFRASADHDGLPFRATSEINAVIRRVATRHGAVLVDAEAALSTAVPGNELFYDNVHPRPEAARRIADALAAGLVRAGAVPAASPAAVPGGGGVEAERRTAGYWLRWACVRGHDPGWRLGQARAHALRALELDPGNADARAMLALADAVEGGPPPRLEEGLRARMSAIHPSIREMLAAR